MPLELDQTTPDMSQSAGEPIGAHGEIDREGEVAKQDLEKISSYAQKLDDRLQDTDQLEAWVQKKIAVAAENLASVYHYLAYEMKVNEYAEYLRKNGLLSEGTSHPAVRKLMEAKAKIKELKKAQVDKKAEKKVAEGVLSGGERPCTECGGTGMVYEEPKPIPSHVKGKVEKYNTMVKATRAAHKRMEEEGEMDEDFGGSGDKEMKVGDTKKTRTGELTKTSTGVVHKNTSYHDDGEAEEKSGKGIKSHAKSQSAAEKKEKAPAQKMSPKSAKTWGMSNSEKFDNRDKVDEAKKKSGHIPDRGYDGDLEEPYPTKSKPHPPGHLNKLLRKKLGEPEKEVNEAKAKCCCEEKGKTKCPVHGKMAESAKPSAGLSKTKKSAVVKKAKAGGDIGKPGKSFDKVAKAAGGGEKGEKIAAAAMWKNIKETTAYMAEKKASGKKPEWLEKAEVKAEVKSGAKVSPAEKKKVEVKESTDFTRMQEQLARLNRSETKTVINESTEVSRLRTLTNLFKG